MRAGFLISATIVASVAVVWGVLCVCSILFPGPSGEWAGLGVLFAAVVDVPGGVLALAIALAVKGTLPRLRRYCIIASSLALCLPILASIIWENHFYFH